MSMRPILGTSNFRYLIKAERPKFSVFISSSFFIFFSRLDKSVHKIFSRKFYIKKLGSTFLENFSIRPGSNFFRKKFLGRNFSIFQVKISQLLSRNFKILYVNNKFLSR